MACKSRGIRGWGCNSSRPVCCRDFTRSRCIRCTVRAAAFSIVMTARCWAAIRPSRSSAPTGRPAGEVSVAISTMRHYDDPNYQPLFKTDKIALSLKGRQQGEQYFFEGGSAQLPGRCLQLGDDPDQRSGCAARGRVRRRRHCERALFDSHPDARRHRRRQYRRHGAARRPDPRRRRLFRLYRRLHQRQRQVEGRTDQPRAYAEPGRAAGVRRLRGRHRLSPAPIPTTARSAKPPLWPASAASASARC